jgi:Phosphotransferase system, HPr-related proteins
MSRTIESIMRHMATPASRLTDQGNRVEKLEKGNHGKKRHYIWAESRFVRTMLPFHSNIRVGYNGKEVDGKSVWS